MIFIGLLYFIIGGLDVFLQYRLYILSKPLTYVVIGVMVVCVIANYLAEKNHEKWSIETMCVLSVVHFLM